MGFQAAPLEANRQSLEVHDDDIQTSVDAHGEMLGKKDDEAQMSHNQQRILNVAQDNSGTVISPTYSEVHDFSQIVDELKQGIKEGNWDHVTHAVNQLERSG